ncbi:MAG: malate synthase A [Candidatus Marinimicrobia bacterium]|nr:malate synthase A [Candidatus Neomarinimicrobiota bacterium]
MEIQNTLEQFSIKVSGSLKNGYHEILTEDALQFVAKLQNNFNQTRLMLLKNRQNRQDELDNGIKPDFLADTEVIRSGDWKVAPVPEDLQDRRVEITGPVDRKMIINALNSGVKVFMADFEDSNSPTWENIIEGQINLRDAVNRNITFTNPNGKFYELCNAPATLMVRPRGWHLEEKHVHVDGVPMSAGIFDFGLYFYHNARNLTKNGSGPYFYLPKMESHLEARLWNDIFNMAQDELDILRGTIKATVLIETILAAFEMDEILYELREHSAGLNCGRWDYIFSFIKKFRNHADCVLPDRSQVTMDRHFLKSYVNLLVQTCHKRGAHAMGGMAAQIPIKNDPEANDAAMNKVKEDKEREAHAGHDGTWIAHPGLSPIALDAFNSVMPEPNQMHNLREDVSVTAADLLKVPSGNISEEGVRANIRVGIQYVEAWLCGNGCVPLYHLMEDAATAEISRAQLWQWIRHEAKLNDGSPITTQRFENWLTEELNVIQKEIGIERYQSGKFSEAADLFSEMIHKEAFDEFLTIPAYNQL